MEKIEKFFTRHKGLLFFLFSVIFLLVFLLCHFKSDIYNKRNEPAYYYQYSDSTQPHADPGIFSPGSVVEQTFTLEPNTYQSLEVSFTSLAKQNDGTLDIQLTGPSIEEHWTLDCNTIPESGYTKLDFEEPLSLDEATQVSLMIRFDTPSVDLSPSIFMFPNLDSEANSTRATGRELRINGVVVDETLMFRINIFNNSFAIVPFLCITACILIGFAVLYLLRKKIKIEIFALVSMLGLGLVYNFVYTPMSVPDEVAHTASAYHYSNLMTFHFDDYDNVVYMRQDDADMFQASSTALSKHAYSVVSDNFDLIVDDTNLVPVYSAYITTKDLAYVAPAIGITIGRILHLGAYPTYYLGRITNLLFLSLCMYFAMKRMPYGKVALATIALLPMTMHLAASYSYDCYTIGLCMLLFAQLMRLMYLNKSYSAKDFTLTCILALLAIPYKVAYIGIVGIALMLPRKNFKSKKQHTLCKILLISSGLLGIVVLEFPRIVGMIASASTAASVEAAVATPAQAYYSAGYIIQHPIATIALFLRTIKELGNWYFYTLIGQNPGWFQIGLPSFYLVPFCVILLLSFCKNEGEVNSLSSIKKCYLTVLSLIMMALCMLAMMLGWTTIDYNVIQGVQGRYFIPILPLVFLIVRNNTLVLKKNMDHALILSSLFFNIMVLATAFSMTFAL